MVLGGVMVCSLMLAGCGGQGEAPATTESTVQTEAPAATDGSAAVSYTHLTLPTIGG